MSLYASEPAPPTLAHSLLSLPVEDITDTHYPSTWNLEAAIEEGLQCPLSGSLFRCGVISGFSRLRQNGRDEDQDHESVGQVNTNLDITANNILTFTRFPDTFSQTTYAKVPLQHHHPNHMIHSSFILFTTTSSPLRTSSPLSFPLKPLTISLSLLYPSRRQSLAWTPSSYYPYSISRLPRRLSTKSRIH